MPHTNGTYFTILCKNHFALVALSNTGKIFSDSFCKLTSAS
ncbi:MAG: hypothetical protein WCG25_05540 [bacterium]